MRYDIRNLNIWKDQPGRNQALVRNKYKTISNKGTVYPFFLGESFLQMDIACIPNLSVRSVNCLHRRGWNTVGDIINNISSIEDILQIRNCGKTSSEEIFEQMLDLQKSMIPVSDQPLYERIFNKVNGGESVSEDWGNIPRRNIAVTEGRDIICKILQM